MKKTIFDTLLTTKDLSIFKPLLGNRKINESRVKGFVAAFNKVQLLWIAIVNEKMEIIDAQHKIEASRRLGLPVTYIIKKGYGLKEAQEYNRNGGIWLKGDHIASLSTLGVQSYTRLDEFCATYPEFSKGVAESIVANDFGGPLAPKYSDEDGNKITKSVAFRNGLYQMADINLVYDNVCKIMEYKPFLSVYQSGMFVKTLLFLFSKTKFSHDRMIRKLRLQPTKLKQCATRDAYLNILEEIYNYAAKGDDRLYFKTL